MEGMPRFESSIPTPRYEPEGVSGPEDQMYRNQLQINLAKLAFPDAEKPMNAWMGDGPDDESSLAAKFRTWFESPHDHVHLDEVDTLNELLRKFRGETLH